MEGAWIIGAILFAVINYTVANRKNRSVPLWVVLGFFFGVFSTIPLALMGAKDE